MKILVLQLARFGDIFMTWPILSALHRQYEGVEIHGLVRSRFKEALQGHPHCQKVIELPSKEWIASVIEELKVDQTSFSVSLKKVDLFIESLKAEKYDRIINFSFSPLSSYIVHALEREGVQVTGYSRFQDGSFRCCDAVSQYFYDQVGETRENRFHVIDLMASMADVDLLESDFKCAPASPELTYVLPAKYVLVQLGASQSKKSLASFQWVRLFKHLLNELPSYHFVLVGSKEDKATSDEIQYFLKSNKVISLVGQTALTDLFTLLEKAEFALCTDSVLIQMANLKQKRTLSLSFKTVNFWETGPLAPGSAVYLSTHPETFEIQKAAEKIAAFAIGKMEPDFYQTRLEIPRFASVSLMDNDFNWNLIQALYLNASFPVCDDYSFIQICTKMTELNDIICESYQGLNSKNFESLILVIERTEETLFATEKLHSAAAILIRWLLGRRIQLGPASALEVIEEYKKIHHEFKQILKMYVFEEAATPKKEG